MEQIERINDLYSILYMVLTDVCGNIMNSDNARQEEDDKELTIQNFLDDIEELYGETFDSDGEDSEPEDELYGDDGYTDIDNEVTEKESLQVEKLLYFLTHPDTEYDESFAKVAEQMEYPFIQDTILYKHILILMVTSIAYIGLIYDKHREIIAIDEELLEIYDNIIDNPQSIYQLFYDENSQDLVRKIVNAFFDYFCCEQYIRVALSLKLIKEIGKLPKLLKMNPLECFAYMDNCSVEDITKSEIAIQNFRDARDYVITCDFNEELTDDERKDLFLQKIDEYYDHDKAAVHKAIAYVISNVYENLKIDGIDDDSESLAAVIESNAETLDQFIETVQNDTDLFWLIINYFDGFTYCLEPDDLPLLRYDFKTRKGNVKILKRLNPFYDEEERVFLMESPD